MLKNCAKYIYIKTTNHYHTYIQFEFLINLIIQRIGYKPLILDLFRSKIRLKF